MLRDGRHSLTALSFTILDERRWARETTFIRHPRQTDDASVTVSRGRVSLRTKRQISGWNEMEAFVPTDPRSVIWDFLSVREQVRCYASLGGPHANLIVVLGSNRPGDPLVPADSEALHPIEHQHFEAMRMAYFPFGRLLFDRGDGELFEMPLPPPELVSTNPGWRLDLPITPSPADVYVEDGRITAVWRGKSCEAPLASSPNFMVARAEPVFHAFERFRRELGLPNGLPVFVHGPLAPGQDHAQEELALSELEWHVIADAARLMNMGVINGPRSNPLRMDTPEEAEEAASFPFSMPGFMMVMVACTALSTTPLLSGVFGGQSFPWFPLIAGTLFIVWSACTDTGARFTDAVRLSSKSKK